MRRPIAASPMSCSSACRSATSATASRNCRSRWCGRSAQLEKMVRAVTLIPGTTEFGYEPSTVVRTLGPGQLRAGEPPCRARARPT